MRGSQINEEYRISFHALWRCQAFVEAFKMTSHTTFDGAIVGSSFSLISLGSFWPNKGSNCHDLRRLDIGKTCEPDTDAPGSFVCKADRFPDVALAARAACMEIDFQRGQVSNL